MAAAYMTKGTYIQPCGGTERLLAALRAWSSRLWLSVAAWLVIAPVAAAPDLNGTEAPDFALRTVEQRNLRLSEFRGQVVLLNFWAGWCGACRQSMPALNTIYDKYQRAGLVMLSINVDDDTDHVQHMAGSLNIRYPVLLDNRKAVSQLYRLDNLPLTVLIDREGAVRFVHSGYSTGDEQKWLAPLRALLNE